MIDLLICIDDTDNLHSIGTGEIADQIAMLIRKKGWGEASQVSRHQLYIHEDIPYTSHNSSMCFEAKIDSEILNEIYPFVERYLQKHHADGSDPGLCIVNLTEFTAHEELIAFGKRAKKEVLTKEMAYQFAEKHSIYLTEHGGTGLGVIGALAGCGLRLTGNDGRFRGKRKLEKSVMTIAEIVADEKIDSVRTVSGEELPLTAKIDVSGIAKTVLLNHQSTLIVQKKENQTDDVAWEIISKQQLKEY